MFVHPGCLKVGESQNYLRELTLAGNWDLVPGFPAVRGFAGRGWLLWARLRGPLW